MESKIQYTREYFESLWVNMPVEKRAAIVYDIMRNYDIKLAKKRCELQGKDYRTAPEYIEEENKPTFKELDEKMKEDVVNWHKEEVRKNGVPSFILYSHIYSHPEDYFEERELQI